MAEGAAASWAAPPQAEIAKLVSASAATLFRKLTIVRDLQGPRGTSGDFLSPCWTEHVPALRRQ
ncbi:hypothetical protein GCM10018965_015480 [Nonomuraea roseola]